MHRTTVAWALLAIAICISNTLHAGTITVGVLNDPTDIENTGLGVIQALNFGTTGDRTVNGITHANSNGNYSPVDFTGPFGDPGGAFSGDLFELLDGIAGTADGNEPSTMSVGGLTVNDKYLFQTYWIVKDNFSTRKMDVTFEGDSQSNIDANPNSDQAVLIAYEFTAADTTFNASFSGTGGDGNVFLSGFSLQLAELPQPAAIPEPATGLLLMLACLGGLPRRRSL